MFRNLSLCSSLPLVCLVAVTGVTDLRADTITVAGLIQQSTEDGTGPAVNNPTLNLLRDGDLFTILLSFAGAFDAPGVYSLTAADLVFSTPALPNLEADFDSATLIIARSGASDVISILACLTTGSGCDTGNELDLNFMVPAADFHGHNVATAQVPGVLPLDLLEDDGVTDIHGSIDQFSSSTSTPEPTSFLLAGSALITVGLLGMKRRNRPHAGNPSPV